MNTKTAVSKEIDLFTQSLNEDIKVLESTLEQKCKTKAILLMVGKVLEDSLTQLSEIAREFQSIAPEHIQTLRITADKLFDTE
jgi:hypothetical protein